MLSNGISAPSGLKCSQDSMSFSALRRVSASMSTTFCSSGVGSKRSRVITGGAYPHARRASREANPTSRPPSFTSWRSMAATGTYQDAVLPCFRKQAGILNFFWVCSRVSGQVESRSWPEFPDNCGNTGAGVDLREEERNRLKAK
jgi:hypothetical protein